MVAAACRAEGLAERQTASPHLGALGRSSGSRVTLALGHGAALGVCAPGGPGLLTDIWEGFRDQGEA